MNQNNQNNQNNQSSQNFQSSQNPQNPQSPQSSQNPQSPQNPQSSQKLTFLPQHGHYRNLRVYQVTEMIYDITFHFCQRFLQKGDRTIDQMVQAARSGKQNIAEGNQAAATSSETEIKLTNVAKASLEELLDDYEDYLRVRGLQQWGPLHPRYDAMRQYARSNQIQKDYASQIQKMNDEEIANLSITLIHQASYMLQRLLETMQDRFVKEGGIKERMLHARLDYRSNQPGRSYQNPQNSQNNQSSQSIQNNRSSQSTQNNQSSQKTQNPQGTQNPQNPQSL